MILSDIKRYLEGRGQATLADIANHFNADPEAVRGMLEYWMRKGKVSRQTINAACGSSCTKCDSAVTEIFRWGNDKPDQEQPIRFMPDHCQEHK